MVLDYDRIKAAEDYPGLMFEMYAALVKMEMRGLSEGRIRSGSFWRCYDKKHLIIGKAGISGR